MSLIRKALDERYRYQRPHPQTSPPQTDGKNDAACPNACKHACTTIASHHPLLSPNTPIRSLRDLRNRYINTVFFDELEEEALRTQQKVEPPPEPQWLLYLRILTPARARGYTRSMKRELAFKAKYVNQSRWLLRVFMSWRGYVDEWAYVRTMLVRTQRLKFLHKVYVHWWLTVQREIKLRIVLRTNLLKQIWRRFRLWALLTNFLNRGRRLLKLTLSNWRFYLAYKRHVMDDLRGLVLRSHRLPAARRLQHWWRGRLIRRQHVARRRIAKGLFWHTRLWRRIFRLRTAKEQQRIERETRVLALIASRTIAALRSFLLSPGGAEDFDDYHWRLQQHYRSYGLDLVYEEKFKRWRDVKAQATMTADKASRSTAMSLLPPLLQGAARDLVRNVASMTMQHTKTTAAVLSSSSPIAVLTNLSSDPKVLKVKAYKVLEDRCVRDIGLTARTYYRKKHPPPFECTHCARVFVLSAQNDAHEQRGCSAKPQPKKKKGNAKNEDSSQGFAWYLSQDMVGVVETTVLKTFYADLVNTPP